MNIQKKSNVLAGVPEYRLVKDFDSIQRRSFFSWEARKNLGFNYQNKGIYDDTHTYYITSKDKITNESWIGPEDYVE